MVAGKRKQFSREDWLNLRQLRRESPSHGLPILAFGWSTPALLAGAKTVARRGWSESSAARLHSGDLMAGYDRSPGARGRPVALLRLVDHALRQPLSEMPDSDYEAEGWRWLYEHPRNLPSMRFGRPCSREDFSWEQFEAWRGASLTLIVIRFRVEQVLATEGQFAGRATAAG